MAFAGGTFWRHKSGDEGAAQRDFWRSLGRVAGHIPFAEDLLAAYYCAYDRNTPRRVQLAIVGALAYFVMPIDAVPDFLPLLGFTDDAAVLAGTLKLVSDHITPAHRAAAAEKLREFSSRR